MAWITGIIAFLTKFFEFIGILDKRLPQPTTPTEQIGKDKEKTDEEEREFDKTGRPKWE